MKKVFCLIVLLSFSLLIYAKDSGWKFSVISWSVNASTHQDLVREYEAKNEAGQWVLSYDKVDTSSSVDVVYIFKVENSKVEMSFWEFSEEFATCNFLNNEDVPRGYFYGVSLLTGDSWSDIYPLPYYNRLSDIYYFAHESRKVKSFEILYKISKLRAGFKYVTIENLSDYLVNMEYHAGLMPFLGEMGKSSQSKSRFSGIGPYLSFGNEFKLKKFSIQCDAGVGILLGETSHSSIWSESDDVTYGRIREFYEESFPLSQSQIDNVFVSGFVVSLNYQIGDWSLSVGIKNETFYDVSMAPLFSSPKDWRSPGADNEWVKSNDDVSLVGFTFGVVYSW